MTVDLIVMHGCQNRFAIVDEGVSPIPELRKSALVLAVAARLDIHGVLFLATHGGPRMRIFDRYGTEATMCGNGIRCAARYFRDHGCVTGSTATAYVCTRIGRTSFPVLVRLLGGELVIDASGDSLTMRGPAEYMRPFALEWPVENVRFGSSLARPTMRLSLAGSRAGEG